MNNRRLVILSVLAVIGYIGLFLIFPQTNPAARWNLELDRDEAIAKAEAVAVANGFTPSKRADDVAVEYRRDDEYYRSRQANPILESLLTPLTARIRLVDAKCRSGFEVKRNSHGELVGYRLRESRSTSTQPDGKSQQPPVAEALNADQKIADEALKRLLGARYGKFSFLSGSNIDKEGV